jgi:hypothetical protein
MKGTPKVGTTGEEQFVVERSHAIAPAKQMLSKPLDLGD